MSNFQTEQTVTSLLQGEEEEVRVPKLSHAIAARLRDQIISGQRKAGDNLPSEAELLLMFKVSRPTIREALRILEMESLIVLGRGSRSGATVTGPSVERAAEYAAMVLVRGGTTLGELHEARMLLEPALVMQLAKKPNPELIAALRAQLDAGLQALTKAQYAQAIGCVNNFHEALVSGSNNRALMLMVGMLKVLSLQSVEVLAQSSSEESVKALRLNLKKTLSAYEQLIALLEQGSASEVYAYWSKYMESANTFMEKTGIGKRKLHT